MVLEDHLVVNADIFAGLSPSLTDLDSGCLLRR
jgi:hypothetical protein